MKRNYSTVFVIDRSQTVYQLNLSVSCPDGFQWDVDARKCYSSEIYGPVKGGDTIGRCQSILPEAQPFEPKDDSQMAYVRRAAGEIQQGNVTNEIL